MRAPRALIVDQLRNMEIGDSTAFVREVRELPVPSNDASRFTQLIGGYALRARPGCSWGYESFAGLSTAGRVLTGAIVSLRKITAELEPLVAWRVAGEWYVNKLSAEKNAKAGDAKLEAVAIPTTPAALVALLTEARAEVKAEMKAESDAHLRAELSTVRQELATATRLLSRYKRHVSSLNELSEDES